jgi:CBS domain-containing protein
MSTNVRVMLSDKKAHLGVLSIGPEAKVLTALGLMKRDNVGALIVMADNRFLGIITERDIARKVEVEGKSAAETPVREIMTCCDDIVTVRPEAELEDCLVIMRTHNIRHLPVLEGEGVNEKVVGVISIRDLAEEIVNRSLINDFDRENQPPS